MINNKNLKKRKYIRAEIETTVKYQMMKYRNWYSSITKSLGAGGVSLISREYLGIGTKIYIELYLTGIHAPIPTTGKVLWSDFLPDKNIFISGIKFLTIDNSDEELIIQYIEKVF